LNQGKDYHIIFAKDPNSKAIDDIWNRIWGRPKEQMELHLKGKQLKEMQTDIRTLIEIAKKDEK